MKITQESSDDTVLKELGDRLARYRLNRNLTQAKLAREAGLSSRTLMRMEAGEAVSTGNLIRALRAHGLLDNFEALVPAPPVSPIQQVRLQGKERKRASPRQEPPQEPAPWSWGEHE